MTCRFRVGLGEVTWYDEDGEVTMRIDSNNKVTTYKNKQEPVAWMRMPKVGDRVVCIEDEDLGTVQSLTAGGSPDIKFDDGSHGTYLLREFAELFRYADTHPQPKQKPVELVSKTPPLYPMEKEGETFSVEYYEIDTQPKREWVGLTEQEETEILLSSNTVYSAMKFTEAKLMEKNK